MKKSDTFVLDAFLKDVISNATFNAVLSAVLPNGHEMVALPRREEKERAKARLKLGERVRVEMSPFDMSKGTFLF